VKTQLEVTNINTSRTNRNKSYYDDDRGGAFLSSETAKRDSGPEIELSFLGAF